MWFELGSGRHPAHTAAVGAWAPGSDTWNPGCVRTRCGLGKQFEKDQTNCLLKINGSNGFLPNPREEAQEKVSPRRLTGDPLDRRG